MSFIFRAFLKGMDGVCIIGCWPGECNYATGGNYLAYNMVQLCKKILEYIGINPERLMIDWCNSSQGIRFAELINSFSAKIRELGPLGSSEGIDEKALKEKLEEVLRLVPYIKIAKRDKLSARFDDVSKYDGFYTREEVEELFTKPVSYYIDPEKCIACGTCRRRCPVGAIDGDKNVVHVIDQSKCIRCGTCYEVCPPKVKAVKKIVGEPVPPPPPEDKRIIKREARKAAS